MVSTTPTIAESIAAPGLPVDEVDADQPSRTTTTVSPTPASTESSASSSSPASEPSTFIGRTTRIRLPSYLASFCVATTLPTTRPRIIRSTSTVAVISDSLVSFPALKTPNQLFQQSCNRKALLRAETERKLHVHDTRRPLHQRQRRRNQWRSSAFPSLRA